MVNTGLTRDWIQYLKSSQIAALKSDPSTGKLTYRRPVSEDDVLQFLRTSTDYSDKEIEDAMSGVHGTSTEISNHPLDSSPGSPPDEQSTTGISPPETQSRDRRRKFSNDDAEDIAFRDVDVVASKGLAPRLGTSTQAPRLGTSTQAPRLGTSTQAPQPTQPPQPPKSGGKVSGVVSQTPDAERKRAARAAATKTKTAGTGAFSRMASHLKTRSIDEDFADSTAGPLSERDVEAIFNNLPITPAATAPESQDTHATTGAAQPPTRSRVDEFNSIKHIIRDSMSDQQRMSLWRALTDA